MPQLKFSAAKTVNEMALRFYKEFKDAKPEDFAHLSMQNYSQNKPKGKKNEGNGLISLTYDDESTGTDDC